MTDSLLCPGCGHWRPNILATGWCAHCDVVHAGMVLGVARAVLCCIECGLEKSVRELELRPRCQTCRLRGQDRSRFRRTRHYVRKNPAYILTAKDVA